MVHAILLRLATGVPWRDLPERFGPWHTADSRFRRWRQEQKQFAPWGERHHQPGRHVRIADG